MRVLLGMVIMGLAFCSTAANAALLNGIEGRVAVNKGDGFRTVSGATDVAPGDTVTVRGEGQALVQFDNGCVAKITSNQTVTIPTDPPCIPGASDITPLVVGGLIVGAGVGIIVAASDDDDPPPSPASP